MTPAPRIRADMLRSAESLYGPTRAERPSDVHDGAVVCPFCPGNEDLTGALVSADRSEHWQSRVVANKFPAVVEPDGRHEVVIETRAHAVVWAALELRTLARILRIYVEREAAGYADGYAFVSVFKNSGAAAGASLRHPHAQIIALRAVPRSIAARIERLTSTCAVCTTLAHGSEQIVMRSEAFVAYVPDGSRTAFEVRIAPVIHSARLSLADAGLLPALAQMLADVMKRLAAALGEDFPFNVVVQSAPREPRAVALMHWEIEVVPRLENFGGYELGTGGYLVSRLPEDAAAILRSNVTAVRSPAKATHA